jgi:putative CocE/NonD family hydrolase
MARFRFLATALASLVVLAAAAAPSQATVPEGTEWTEHYFESGDGTQLHADVLRPKGVAKSPIILAIGPYFGHSAQAVTDFDPTASGPNERFADMYKEGKIFEKGYTLVMVDLPGFGASHGCNDFGGPAEQAAVKAAVEWAAGQEWSTGKVGMWGKSYDGWTEVMALATKPKGLAAAVIMSPIINGYGTLYQRGVHYSGGWYSTPALYQGIDATPPSINDSPEYLLNVAQGTNPACYAQNIAVQNSTIDDSDPFWQIRDLRTRAKGSNVPVLWSHGLVDANTKPDQFLDIYSTLTGPHRGWFGQYSHRRPQDKKPDGSSQVGREGFIDEAMRWMDRYVKGVPAEQARVEDDPGVEVQDGGLKKYRAEAAWPPADAAAVRAELNGGTTLNTPDNNADNGGGLPYGPSRTVGEGNWTISQALPYDVHLAGVPKVTVKTAGLVGPRPNLYAALYDIDADKKATLLSRGAQVVLAAGELTFELYPQDWTVAKGHRIGFAFAPSDNVWYLASAQGSSVEVTEASISLPFLRYQRDSFLKGQLTQDQEEAPDPFDVSSRFETAGKTFPLPPELTTPPAATLPGTPTGKKRAKLSTTLRAVKGKRGRLRAAGTAPAGVKVTVRLRRGTKTIATRTVKASKTNRWSATFRVGKAGRYVVLASVREAGATVRVRSRAVVIRSVRR